MNNYQLIQWLASLGIQPFANMLSSQPTSGNVLNQLALTGAISPNYSGGGVASGMQSNLPAAPWYDQILGALLNRGSGGSFGLRPSPIESLLAGLFGYQQVQKEKAPYNLQMEAANMGVNNPAAITSMINRATRQLSPQLVNSVMRSVAPSIAARGLAQSPGMTEQIEAEALAPYQMQEQQLAQQQVLAGLQAPFSVGSGLAGQYPSDLFSWGSTLGEGAVW